MKISSFVFTIVVTCSGCTSNRDLFISKFTAINPVSYTDAIYAGIRDTVLVLTFSGRIAKRINGVAKEMIISNIDREIYSLAYNHTSRVIAASTLEDGILLINEKNGRIVKQIRLKSTWSNNILFSDDFNYSTAIDQKGNVYLWDAKNDYKEIVLPSDFPKGIIRSINNEYIANIISKKSTFLWDLKSNKLLKSSQVNLTSFADMDKHGHYLSIDFNECKLYDSNSGQVKYTIKHPNWPLPNVENDLEIFDIPFHMQLTTAKFAGNKIYTASIDRTIREWDKETGILLRSITEHKASVNKIRISKDEKQIVSIDLKGGIHFLDVN